MDNTAVTIDAAKTAGNIEPLNDMNCGPVYLGGYFDFTSFYRELGVQYVRLHDVPFTFGDVVDINYVFPHADADPELEASYEFGQMDFYIQTILSQGMKVMYCLGYSAEFEKSSLVHNAPPSSFENWASVCAHIMRHYNQGWAKGKELGIKYWEIWNEPDSSGFWSGKPEDFYRLFDVTARAIKAQDPSIRVGGPALAQNLDFLEGMLKYCQERKTPIDFLSWHQYAWDSDDVVARAQGVHSLLVKYGYPNAESIIDEWNFVPADYAKLDRPGLFSQQAGTPGAAFDAAVLIKLQDIPVDRAMFYTGTNLIYGLIDEYGVPHKVYCSFRAVRSLLECPKRLTVNYPDKKMPVLAGSFDDHTMLRVLISNAASAPREVEFNIENLPCSGGTCEKQVLSDQSNLGGRSCKVKGSSKGTITEELAPTSVCLITLRRAAG